MKSKYKYSLLLMTLVLSAVLLRCTKSDEMGTPSISYIRITNPASADSLLTSARQGQVIAIMGQNLGSVRQLWFNDQPAPLIPTAITNTTILTQVPAELPSVITNKMKLVFANGTSLDYDFSVDISGPRVDRAQCEYVSDGDSLYIFGNYLYPPIKVTFKGGNQSEPFTVSSDYKSLGVKVPAGAQTGPITVTTNFGETVSSFYFRDNRNIVLDYDNLTSAGSWRPGSTGSSGGIGGNYLILKGMLTTNQRTEDYPGGGFVSEFWAKVNGRPQGNFVTGDPSKLSMKFEVNINDWYGSYLNICWAPWDQNNNNQEYWSNLNARAIWGAWDVADKEIKNSGWMTVTIPITDFKYQQGTPGGVVTYTAMTLDPNITGSISFWVVGSPKASSSGSPVDLHIDNVRIVPN